MGFFSDAMLFLSLTLLTIIITIFVIAVSFLGRAIDKAKKEEEILNKKQVENRNKLIHEAQDGLNRAKASNEGENEAIEKLESLKRNRRKFGRDLKKVADSYRLLTVKRGVVCPGSALLLSTILSAIAKYLTTLSGKPALVAPAVLLFMAAIGIVWASYRIFKTLLVVQSVAVAPEDMLLNQMADALTLAMKRHADSLLPKIELKFVKPEPPFIFDPTSEHKLEYSVENASSTTANDINIDFVAPDGLEFPGSDCWHRPAYISYPDALSTRQKIPVLKGSFQKPMSVNMKTPSKEGKYLLVCLFACDGFASGFKEYLVTVRKTTS